MLLSNTYSVVTRNINRLEILSYLKLTYKLNEDIFLYLTGCPNWRQYCNGPPPAQIFMTEHCKRTCDACDDTSGPSFSCPAKTTNVDMEGPLFVPVLDRNRKATIIKRRGKDRREKNKSQPWHLAPREEYFKPENFVHLRGKMFDSECNELNQPSDWINIWYAGATSMQRGREGYYYIQGHQRIL